MERNCDKCIHHTSGTCDSWDCKMQTVEDVKREAREKAVEEFAVALKEKCKEKMDVFGFGSLQPWEINRIANELKKNLNENQTEVKGE